ncbi:flocculation protein FLO11-like [Thalassophryne amazonica]|uniref:flocculation protein FLO11-like n=1 Tax=Thalassophryne amazonica TaxID=390379 RepID=UPI001471A385|nr:flocculation protein FLO11-like [Thalassophryne amazonica]
MNSIRVFVLLLVASSHLFIPAVSSQDPPTPSTKPILTATTSTVPNAAAATSKTAAATDAAKAAGTDAAAITTATTKLPKILPATQTAPATTVAAPIEPTTPATSASKTEAPAPMPAKTTLPPPAPPTPLPTALPTTPKVKVKANETASEMGRNNTLEPRSSKPAKNASGTLNTSKDTQRPDESFEIPTIKGPGAPTRVPDRQGNENKTSQEKGAGSQTGGEKKESPKSDKRLWWILLPVLLVGAAASIFILRFKFKKVHDHTDTFDTGTENASFQSRPESTKDGVMLLGVKSSSGEENSAAR